jgi:hypothetical protein
VFWLSQLWCVDNVIRRQYTATCHMLGSADWGACANPAISSLQGSDLTAKRAVRTILPRRECGLGRKYVCSHFIAGSRPGSGHRRASHRDHQPKQSNCACASPVTSHRTPREGVNPSSHWPEASALRARSGQYSSYNQRLSRTLFYL